MYNKVSLYTAVYWRRLNLRLYSQLLAWVQLEFTIPCHPTCFASLLPLATAFNSATAPHPTASPDLATASNPTTTSDRSTAVSSTDASLSCRVLLMSNWQYVFNFCTLSYYVIFSVYLYSRTVAAITFKIAHTLWTLWRLSTKFPGLLFDS